MNRRIEDVSLRDFIQLKIIVIGDSGVGKTSFLHRYINDVFETDTQPTINIDIMNKRLFIKNEPVQLCFHDTAGTERFAAISNNYYKGSCACIIMYDVTRKSTFTSVERWLSKLQSILENTIPIIIIGNKTDICQEREISTEEGEKYAKTNKCYFIETSCLNGTNVNEAIDIVIKNGITTNMLTTLKSSQIGVITPQKPLLASQYASNSNTPIHVSPNSNETNQSNKSQTKPQVQVQCCQ